MKKVFSKFVVLALAFVMVCALGACGDKAMIQVNSAGEAVSGAAAAMLKQNGMTVTVNGSVSALGELTLGESGSAISLKSIPFDGTFKMSKSETDLDFDLDVGATLTMGTVSALTMGTVSAPMRYKTVKKGKKMFTSMGGEWVQEAADAIVIPPIPDEAFDALKSLDMGNLVKNKNSYTLTLSADFGSPLAKLQNFLKENGTKSVNEWLFPDFGEEENSLLATKLGELLDDEITVKEFVAKLDEILNIGKEEGTRSVKAIVDELTAAAGLTAKDAEALLKQIIGETAPEAGPTDTVYDYVMNLVDEDMRVEELLLMLKSIIGGIGGGFSPAPSPDDDIEYAPYTDSVETEPIEPEPIEPDPAPETVLGTLRNILIPLLTEKGDDFKVANIYDSLIGELDFMLEKVLGVLGNAEVVQSLSATGPMLSSANIAKMTFGENLIELKVEFNGNDLTLRNITLKVRNNIKFDGKQLTDTKVDINVDFSYGSVSITEPDMKKAA